MAHDYEVEIRIEVSVPIGTVSVKDDEILRDRIVAFARRRAGELVGLLDGAHDPVIRGVHADSADKDNPIFFRLI